MTTQKTVTIFDGQTQQRLYDLGDGTFAPASATVLGVALSTAVAGSFTATGVSAPFTPIAGRAFNIALWAAATTPAAMLGGTVYLERSTDGGTTFLPVTAAGIQLGTWTAVASEAWSEDQVGVQYKLVCSAFSSGPINYRISQ